MSGGLSTHVLDLATGRPAGGIKLELFHDDACIFAGATNTDGRCPELLGGVALAAGPYRLVFQAGDYLARQGQATPAFFDVVTVAFTIVDPDAHHHVPLLLSPFGYSTYRGS